jgi:hypothetical protein
MAHFAKVEQGVVTAVIVAEPEFIATGAMGDPALWVQTSYNTHGGVHYVTDTGVPSADQTKALRKNYASIGYTYDAVRDAFIPIKPFSSWVLNEQTCVWEAPTPKPQDGHVYEWDEAGLQWARLSHPSWSVNPTTGLWEPPVPYPDNADEGMYTWDESIVNWVPVPAQPE